MVLHETTMYSITEEVGVRGSLRGACREEAAGGRGGAAERTGEGAGSLAVCPRGVRPQLCNPASYSFVPQSPHL